MMIDMPAALIGIENDITLEEAIASRSGISMDPELRGKQIVQGHIQDMKDTYEHLKSLVKTPEQQKILDEWFPIYREGMVKRRKTMLARDSRVMSTMITGRGNFPVRSQQRKQDSAQKALEDVVNYDEYMVNKIKAKLKGTEDIKSTDKDAIEKLNTKLQKLEKAQSDMKAANKIVRSKKLSDEEKIQKLQDEVRLSEKLSKEIMQPDLAGRVGFPSYSHTNNNAKIKATKKRIADIEQKKELAQKPKQKITFDGGYLTQDFEADRIQFIFNDKPDEETRALLKSRGFRWSPKNGAWQRMITVKAQHSAREILRALG